MEVDLQPVMLLEDLELYKGPGLDLWSTLGKVLLPLLLGINLERPNLDIAHEGNSLDLKKVELELDRYLSEVATLDLYLKLMVPDLLVLHLTNLLSYRPNLAALLTALGLTTCFLAPPCYPLISAYCPFSIIMCCRRCSSVCFLSLLLTHAYYSRSSHFVLPLPRRCVFFPLTNWCTPCPLPIHFCFLSPCLPMCIHPIYVFAPPTNMWVLLCWKAWMCSFSSGVPNLPSLCSIHWTQTGISSNSIGISTSSPTISRAGGKGMSFTGVTYK